MIDRQKLCLYLLYSGRILNTGLYTVRSIVSHARTQRISRNTLLFQLDPVEI